MNAVDRGYKEGDKFVITGNVDDEGIGGFHAFSEGDIVELVNDDGSMMPLFVGVTCENPRYVGLENFVFIENVERVSE